MKRIAIEDPKLSIQELVQMAEAEPVILTRSGTPVVGVLEVDQAEIEAWSLGGNLDFIAMIERFRERGRREGRIPLEEVRRRCGVAKGASNAVGSEGGSS